ncbi:hypothetical protein HK101_005627 [Irineochytrium annulatum]|nr:hypothetical protein HK101_005627 [Irineochytrium annulatum]
MKPTRSSGVDAVILPEITGSPRKTREKWAPSTLTSPAVPFPTKSSEASKVQRAFGFSVKESRELDAVMIPKNYHEDPEKRVILRPQPSARLADALPSFPLANDKDEDDARPKTRGGAADFVELDKARREGEVERRALERARTVGESILRKRRDETMTFVLGVRPATSHIHKATPMITDLHQEHACKQPQTGDLRTYRLSSPIETAMPLLADGKTWQDIRALPAEGVKKGINTLIERGFVPPSMDVTELLRPSKFFKQNRAMLHYFDGFDGFKDSEEVWNAKPWRMVMERVTSPGPDYKKGEKRKKEQRNWKAADWSPTYDSILIKITPHFHGQLRFLILKLENFLSGFNVPWAEIRCDPLIAAATMVPFMNMTAMDLLEQTVSNAKDVMRVIRQPGRRLHAAGVDTRLAAATIIQAAYRRHKSRFRFQFFLRCQTAGRVFLKWWRYRMARRKLTASMAYRFENVHVKRFHRLMGVIRRDWSQIQARKRLMILVGPKFGEIVDMEILAGKLIVLLDPQVECVLILKHTTDEMMDYLQRKLGCGRTDFYPQDDFPDAYIEASRIPFKGHTPAAMTVTDESEENFPVSATVVVMTDTKTTLDFSAKEYHDPSEKFNYSPLPIMPEAKNSVGVGKSALAVFRTTVMQLAKLRRNIRAHLRPRREMPVDDFIEHWCNEKNVNAGGLIQGVPCLDGCKVRRIEVGVFVDPRGKWAMIASCESILSKEYYQVATLVPMRSMKDRALEEIMGKLCWLCVGKGVVGYLTLQMLTWEEEQTGWERFWFTNLFPFLSPNILRACSVSVSTGCVVDPKHGTLSFSWADVPMHLRKTHLARFADTTKMKKHFTLGLMEALGDSSQRCAVFVDSMEHSEVFRLTWRGFCVQAKNHGVLYDSKAVAVLILKEWRRVFVLDANKEDDADDWDSSEDHHSFPPIGTPDLRSINDLFNDTSNRAPGLDEWYMSQNNAEPVYAIRQSEQDTMTYDPLDFQTQIPTPFSAGAEILRIAPSGFSQPRETGRRLQRKGSAHAISDWEVNKADQRLLGTKEEGVGLVSLGSIQTMNPMKASRSTDGLMVVDRISGGSVASATSMDRLGDPMAVSHRNLSKSSTMLDKSPSKHAGVTDAYHTMGLQMKLRQEQRTDDDRRANDATQRYVFKPNDGPDEDAMTGSQESLHGDPQLSHIDDPTNRKLVIYSRSQHHPIKLSEQDAAEYGTRDLEEVLSDYIVIPESTTRPTTPVSEFIVNLDRAETERRYMEEESRKAHVSALTVKLLSEGVPSDFYAARDPTFRNPTLYAPYRGSERHLRAGQLHPDDLPRAVEVLERMEKELEQSGGDRLQTAPAKRKPTTSRRDEAAPVSNRNALSAAPQNARQRQGSNVEAMLAKMDRFTTRANVTAEAMDKQYEVNKAKLAIMKEEKARAKREAALPPPPPELRTDLLSPGGAEAMMREIPTARVKHMIGELLASVSSEVLEEQAEKEGESKSQRATPAWRKVRANVKARRRKSSVVARPTDSAK